MTSVNGIGNPQQTITSIASSVATPTAQATSSSGEANKNAVSSPKTQPADQTNLSAAAGLVAQALEGSDVRAEKVASLQKAITAGSYSVRSSDVADKIIRSLSE
jgi:negative regulator of flagellin synthesis FlgM